MGILTITRMRTTKILVFLPSTLFFSIFLTPALPLLVFLPLALSLLILLSPISLFSGPLNHDSSSPLFHFSSCYCSSLFFVPHFTRSGGVFYQNLDAHSYRTTPPSLFPMQVIRAISLPLEEDYAVHSITLLGISRKRL